MSSSSSVDHARSWRDFAGPIGSNAAQNYLTHSLFRYFGKLPPVLTGQIIDKFVPQERRSSGRILDFMCGSGTTLVEAQHRRILSAGVDVNPVAILASEVKTRPIDDHLATDLLASAKEFASTLPPVCPPRADWGESIDALIPSFPNRDRWFPPATQYSLAKWRDWVSAISDPHLHDFALLAWLGIVRQASLASARTGRIFFDVDKPEQDVSRLVQDRLGRNRSVMAAVPQEHFSTPAMVYAGDARVCKLDAFSESDLVVVHPPYFALYKYSSDVLRFELEWGGYSRRVIAAGEIEDGFKTTRAELMYAYLDDLSSVIVNALSHTRTSGFVVVVVGNSTLSERQLPIVSELVSRMPSLGAHVEEIFERDIDHAQVKYHRSKNPNIKSDTDFVIVLSPR